MSDKFDEMMGLFLEPMERLGPRITDSVYFLRKDGSLVFAQGYLHPEGLLSGKVIYYPQKGGWVDIFGREYECMHKTYRDGKMISWTNPQQIERHYEVFPEMKGIRERPPIIKNNLLFPLSDFVGFFDPKKSMRLCRELYPDIDRGVRDALDLLGVPEERVGCTGSLQYGRIEEHDEDIDFFFYGTVEENYGLLQKLYGLVQSDPSRHVHEFNKFWPMRLWHKGTLVCPFFAYADEREIPLHDCRIETLGETALAEGTVSDIRHTIYMPLVIPLSKAVVEGEPRDPFKLVIGDSYVRGEFSVGDHLKIRGRWIRVEKDGARWEGIIAGDNWDVQNIRPAGFSDH